jgi:SAM-dependent methyltransferase
MTTGRSRTPRDLFGGVSDDFWLWAFTEGHRTDARLREVLPAFPPDDIQLRYAGAAGDDTMRDAFGFYSLVKNLAGQHLRRPLESVIEFGCGWGRILRLFLRDIEPHQLWGIDCLPGAIDICTSTNPYCQFTLVDPFPPASLAPDAFDLVYAYSVFSHLSERAHLEWLAEFKRILKPGGLVIATTRSREFIFTCAETRDRGERAFWAQGTAFSFKNTEQALARYDRGEFLYEPVGGGDVLDASFFGETCIPQKYVRDNWTRLFEFVGYLDDRRLCQQNVIVARKA